MNSILEKVNKLRGQGLSVAKACKKLKVSSQKYYYAARLTKPKKLKRAAKLQVTEIAIQPARVFAFYGSPNEIASILRGLQ